MILSAPMYSQFGRRMEQLRTADCEVIAVRVRLRAISCYQGAPDSGDFIALRRWRSYRSEGRFAADTTVPHREENSH